VLCLPVAPVRMPMRSEIRDAASSLVVDVLHMTSSVHEGCSRPLGKLENPFGTTISTRQRLIGKIAAHAICLGS
jgi:hypothetical protein